MGKNMEEEMAKRYDWNWEEIIREQEVSGKSIRHYCEEKGINETTFYINRKKVKERGFVEIKLRDKGYIIGVESVELKAGKYSILLKPGFRKEVLEEVLRAS